jgi:hypothetical protein
MKFKNELLINFTLIIATLLGFFFRYDKNFYDGYWADEILTLEISNPSLSYENFLSKWRELDDSPKFYFLFLRYFFKIFDFTAEYGRIFSIFFNTLAIFFSYFIFTQNFNHKISLTGVLLISLNIFLIWQAKETRIQSSVIFFSIINIIFFFYYLKKNNFFNLLILVLSNVFLISYYPFTVCIVVSQFFYLLLTRNKIFKSIVIFSLIMLIYVSLNYDYFILKIHRPDIHIGPLNIKFFFNYFFSSFFGSIYLGALYLFLFILSVFIILKKKMLSNKFLLFHFILIFFSYLFLIFYSIFKTEIAVPRYFIFLIPSIIFIILQLFTFNIYHKYLITFIFLTFINTIFLYPRSSIPKPSMKNLLDNMPLTDSNIILHNEEYYSIYYKNYRKFTNNYKVISKNEANLYKKIWFICLNNPRSIVGDLILPEEEKCKFELNNFREIRKIYITDFKIVLFEKND